MHRTAGKAVLALLALMTAGLLAVAQPSCALAAGATAQTEIGIVFVEEPEASASVGEGDSERGEVKPLPGAQMGDGLLGSLALTGDRAAGAVAAAGLLAVGALACVAAASRLRPKTKGKKARHGR